MRADAVESIRHRSAISVGDIRRRYPSAKPVGDIHRRYPSAISEAEVVAIGVPGVGWEFE
jgi:hypothetical protein